MQSHHTRGVVDAQGNLRIEALPLLAGETVDVIILPTVVNGSSSSHVEQKHETDPLAGVRIATGIQDLAERFDDCLLIR